MYREPIFIVTVIEIFDNVVDVTHTLFEKREHAITTMNELFEIYLKKHKVKSLPNHLEAHRTIVYKNDYIAEIKLSSKAPFYDNTTIYEPDKGFIEI